MAVGYALPMSARPTEHRSKIADARNVLGEVIARARFAGEPTILINRGKEAAVIVSPDFYEQALANERVVEAVRRYLDGLPAEERAAHLGPLLEKFDEVFTEVFAGS